LFWVIVLNFPALVDSWICLRNDKFAQECDGMAAERIHGSQASAENHQSEVPCIDLWIISDDHGKHTIFPKEAAR
jgi:hypothetical protein